MAIYRSVQYMAYCDGCKHSLIDYGDIEARNQSQFEARMRSIALWKKIDGKWLCPDCQRRED